MLEKEYKSLLTYDRFNAVKDRFEWDSRAEQTNNYYADADGIFAANKIMFRVRERDGGSVIQVKLRKNDESVLQVCEELEFKIDGVPQTIENPSRYTGVESGDAHRMGASKTLRYSKMWDESTEICLDMTTYFDICDYEIEIEYTADDIPDELKTELEKLGIKFEEPAKGKFARFLSAYNAAPRQDFHKIPK